jgi:molybdopterin molybdotransferase
MKPLIAAMLGQPPESLGTGRLAEPVNANDERQDYLRARLTHDVDGVPLITPLPAQDSSLTRVLSEADALLIRTPHSPAGHAGESCTFLPLE